MCARYCTVWRPSLLTSRLHSGHEGSTLPFRTCMPFLGEGYELRRGGDLRIGSKGGCHMLRARKTAAHWGTEKEHRKVILQAPAFTIRLRIAWRKTEHCPLVDITSSACSGCSVFFWNVYVCESPLCVCICVRKCLKVLPKCECWCCHAHPGALCFLWARSLTAAQILVSY